MVNNGLEIIWNGVWSDRSKNSGIWLDELTKVTKALREDIRYPDRD
jgi:hypothetical protein